MAKAKTEGEQALESAIERYAEAKSAQGRELKKSLRELQANRKVVSGKMEKRAAQRKADAAAYKKKTAQAAQIMHDLRVQEYEQIKKLGSKELEQVAASLLEAARIHLDTVKTAAGAMDSAAELRTTLDNQMFFWLDNLIVDAVATLDDDSAVDRVIASLSAATIVTGVTTGPVGAVASAVAAAMLLIVDSSKRFSKKARVKSEDAAALRIERAKTVIGSVADLTKQWANLL